MIVMKDSLISSFDRFVARNPQLKDDSGKRTIYLKRYFEKGGIVSVVNKKSSSWPLLRYPSPLKIRQLNDELKAEKQRLEKELSDWKKRNTKAKYSDLSLNVKKFKDKLFWKHSLKMVTDSDYRTDAKEVSLPSQLVSTERFRPMIDMFVNNIEYRKQLTETVKDSIVYKNNRKLGQYNDQIQAFRLESSDKKIKELEKDLSDLKEDELMLRQLLSWANSR
ncbi:MAG: hypothetical protein ABH821_02560 [archaeon]